MVTLAGAVGKDVGFGMLVGEFPFEVRSDGMTNDQAPNPNQIPRSNDQLGFGYWILIGILGLVIGYFALR
jgi:hypothetical protein